MRDALNIPGIDRTNRIIQLQYTVDERNEPHIFNEGKRLNLACHSVMDVADITFHVLPQMYCRVHTI